MSGFAGVLHLDGRPADAALVSRLADLLEFCGPDGRAVRVDGAAGLAQTYFHTGLWPRELPPPISDGSLHLIGDLRLDGRDDLRRALGSRDQESGAGGNDPGDAEILFRSYRKWGLACVDHLHGDFAFGLWDESRQRLFCACDRLGVKPFFYAQQSETLVFSNAAHCLLACSEISDKVNDEAIADFLLFECNLSAEATALADVRRLPPGCVLVAEKGRVTRRRYFELASWLEGIAVERRSLADLVEGLNERLGQAVADRLRGADRAVIFLSGGLDSSAVAAHARRLLPASKQLSAVTVGFERLFADKEADFARQAAAALELPQEYVAFDDLPLNDGNMDFPSPRVLDPELVSIWPSREFSHRYAAGQGRVALTGMFGDEVLNVMGGYLCGLLAERRLRQFLRDSVRYACYFRRRPPWGVRSRQLAATRLAMWMEAFPDWLGKDFERRLSLRSRWSDFWRHVIADYWSASPSNRLRQCLPMLRSFHDASHPSVTGEELDVRAPFLDLRLIEFLHSVEPIPWRRDKALLREAMRRLLPEAIRRRPKTALQGHPADCRFREGGGGPRWWKGPPLSQRLEEFIDPDRFRSLSESPIGPSGHETDLNLRPFRLLLWHEQLAIQTPSALASGDRFVSTSFLTSASAPRSSR